MRSPDRQVKVLFAHLKTHHGFERSGFYWISAKSQRFPAASRTYTMMAATGKSQFAKDCVVGLGGLEPPTKRLSAATSEH